MKENWCYNKVVCNCADFRKTEQVCNKAVCRENSSSVENERENIVPWQLGSTSFIALDMQAEGVSGTHGRER
jgi:hypothetical protein